VEKIKPEIEAIESKLDKYIEDPDSLTEEEREIINTILEALNLSTDGTGATALKVSFEMVKSFADAYERDPEKAIEDLRGTLMMLLAFAPDLSAAEEQLAQRTEELRGEIAKLNGAIALLDGALGEESASAAVRLTRDTDELADLEAAVKEFQDAKQKRQDFVRYENWSVQKRTDNPSVATAKFYAQSSNKLCFSMSLLFVFVGLMVCYTSVSRNVNEAKVTTGVQKALGFRVREIMAYYMAYSVIAVIMGAVLGYLLGYFVIESIVNNSYAGLFSLGTIPNVYTVTDALVIAAAEIVLICIATFLPCRKHLKRPAVELMKGTSNGDGSTRFYWKFGFWKRLSLYTQTTINNLFGDGARVVATLVGIAGCTALIVMSMSLRFAITGTPEKHFSDVCVYDAYLVSDTSAPQAQENLRRVLSAENCSCISARQSVVYIEDENGELSKADIVVPESEENFREYIRLNDWKSKRALALPEEGVIISRTYEKYHDVKIGDTIRLMDATGVYHECVVAGVSEHYLSTIQLTMSRDYYEKVMNTPFVENVLYINYGDTDVESLQEKLRNTEGYFSLTDECAKWTAKFSEIASTTMLIIYIGLFLSTAMALLVLLNLNIVCVNEKKNELIIMRINGFSNGAVKKYVYRDNIFLTVTGIIIGTISGIGFSQWMLSILQKNGDNFYTKPNIIVILTAVGLASLFSLITNLIALRKIDKLKISDLKR
ncbi:MAG: FtsX-like permease family protein, partial [Candidatus Scatosoma sp.]